MSFSEHSNASTESLSNLTIDIVRDPGVCGEWLNRYCKNADTNEILYYCDVSDDSKLEIHRGNKYGPIIAHSRMCSSKPGATDILVTDRRSRGRVNHIHHDDRTAGTHFVENGRKYHWNGQTELVEDVTGAVLAQLSFNNSLDGSSGKLIIKPEAHYDHDLVDPIVMTALIVQERKDENRSWF